MLFPPDLRLLSIGRIGQPLGVEIVHCAEEEVGFLPEAAVYTLGALGSLVAASWLAAIYGSIPFLAHRSLATRRSEVIP